MDVYPGKNHHYYYPFSKPHPSITPIILKADWYKLPPVDVHYMIKMRIIAIDA
jgi:hypothetical protein